METNIYYKKKGFNLMIGKNLILRVYRKFCKSKHRVFILNDFKHLNISENERLRNILNLLMELNLIERVNVILRYDSHGRVKSYDKTTKGYKLK
jgi:hypothetical protein